MLAPQSDCFTNIVQDFLVCTTIHKAHQLGVFQSAIYVNVSLDKRLRHTKNYENSENPYFNEYFVFEMKCSLMELLRLTILYEVKKQTACKKNPTLGELLIDLQSVWDQPNRCYFKKWGRLEAPIGHSAAYEYADGAGEVVGGGIGVLTKGFLQIDLAIISQASNLNTLLKPYEEDAMILNKWHLNQDYDDIEKNLLQNIDTGVRCNIRYTVTFYRGIMSKKSDYIVQFRFHPFKGKTNVAKNTLEPSWNQEICFLWSYPSLAQTLVIQLLMHEHLQWKCMAEYELHFNEIAFRDKPSLGPTFINLYDNINGSHYLGRVLLAIKSECLDTESTHVMTLKQVLPLEENRYWQNEPFLIEFLVLQGDFIHCSSSNCKISLKLADFNSNSIECSLKDYASTLKKSQQRKKSFKYFLQPTPFKSITLRVQLPDNRRKFESDVYLQDIMDFIKSEIELFKLFQIHYTGLYQSQLKVLRSILWDVIHKMEQSIENNSLDYRSPKQATQWDVNRLIYLKEYFRKLLEDLKMKRSKLKPVTDTYVTLLIDETVEDLIKYCNELQYLLTGSLVQDAWPNLILMLVANNKEIGFCRLNAKNFLFHAKDREESYSDQCWKLKNFIFKDIKCQHTCTNCGCTVAIIRGCLSIVTEAQTSEFLSQVVQQWQHPEPFNWSPKIPFVNFKCRIFIHQAKIKPGSDLDGLCDSYVRVIISKCAAETTILYSTLSPVWNTVITFDNIKLPGDFHWYLSNPPVASIEIYDTDKKSSHDYLGSGVLTLSVVKNDVEEGYAREHDLRESDEVNKKYAIQKYLLIKYLTPPPLKWVSIALSGSIRAEVLVSGELVESENIASQQGNEETCSSSVTVGIPNVIRPYMKNFFLEVIFVGLRNYRKQYFLTRKHRIKLMMADLVLTSGLTTAPINKSMNFLVHYASGVVSLPEQLEYWPAIIATDVSVASKTQETTLGATLIANSKRYLQKEKTIKCSSQMDDTTNSTAIQVESESDDYETDNDENESEQEQLPAETKPLLPNKTKNLQWQKALRKLKVFKRGSTKSLAQNENLKEVLDESEYNWWTKFYNFDFIEPSGRLSDLKHKLCVYANELEKQPEFSYLNDWAENFSLIHGVKYKKNALPMEEMYASLKLNIKITPCNCNRPKGAGGGGGGAVSSQVNGEMLKPLAVALNPRYQLQFQSLAELVKITARVYIVQGLQLRPSMEKNQADAYVKVQLGQKLVSNRADYIPHQSNPIFGKCFQLEGLLPREHILEVSVFNRKDIRDETIGSTFIDLEDRWRSKHRAAAGIAHEYSSTGYNKWHDHRLPSEILHELCKNNSVKPPKITGNLIQVDGVSFEDETQIATSEDLQERLCLTVLRNFEHLPSFGYKLVPQHVETRSLYRNECPGIEQGKIQLWIELYDGNLNIPPPIDITPQPPELYELRVIIYNVAEVILQEKNVFGTQMSDIYIKGWCSSFNDAQFTDIHYRSTNGEGNFNWRMLFPLKYSKTEDMMITKRRTAILEEYEFKQPPTLFLQIWDNDFISPNDFLGSLEINLSAFSEPYETAKKCELLDVTRSITSYGSTITRVAKNNAQRKLFNLFKQKKIRGWFPMRGNVKDANRSGQIGLAAKIELELEVLTHTEATFQPVGMGRNGLELPNRPKTSFNPFTKPWKGAKHVLWPKILKFVVLAFIVFMLGVALMQLFSKFPAIISEWGW